MRKSPIAIYINVDAVLAEATPLPSIKRLRLGRLPLPRWLAHKLQQQVGAGIDDPDVIPMTEDYQSTCPKQSLSGASRCRCDCLQEALERHRTPGAAVSLATSFFNRMLKSTCRKSKVESVQRGFHSMAEINTCKGLLSGELNVPATLFTHQSNSGKSGRASIGPSGDL